MNIFYLHEDGKTAAKMLVNKHVRKMILEYAQLLSTAHHVLDGEEAIEGIYKKTHVNHPCAVWARANSDNYSWLQRHALDVCEEYTKRSGKTHKTQDVLLKLKLWPLNIDRDGKFYEPPKCMPDQYKEDSVVQSYRNYYINDKLKLLEKNEFNPYWDWSWS